MRTKHLIKELYKIGFAKKEAFRLINMYKNFRFKYTNSSILYSVKNTASLRLAFIKSQKGISNLSVSVCKVAGAMNIWERALLAVPDKPQFASSIYLRPV